MDRTDAPEGPYSRNSERWMEAKIGPDLIRAETASDHRKLRECYDADFDRMIALRQASIEAIRDWQFRRIQQIVAHAYETVPLYREKYRAVGFAPADLRGWADFERLPFLTKDDLIAGWPDNSVSSLHNVEFMTTSSGSSGRFVYLAVSENGVHFENLQMARQNIFQSSGQLGPADATLFIITCPWWFSSTDGLFPQDFLSTRTPIEQACRVIREQRPSVISLYPSYLRELARVRVNLSECGVKLVITHSEASTRAERLDLSRALGVPICDEYSSEELIRIALECPFGSYHLEEDACFAEIIDPDTGSRCATDRIGEVVGTNLVNEATPLIRYRQGDFASALGNATRCQCGCTFGRISQPMGRIGDSFVTQSGMIVPAGTIMDDAYNWVLESRIPVNGIQYQIVQHARDRVGVYLVPAASPSSPIDRLARKKIEARMRGLLGDGVEVGVEIVAAIPYARGTKTKAAISLVDHD
ncbi:phenylacetate-CoA ligase [Bradyrhizobium sp. USDA 4501]